ncbi:flagellar motor switch protein FliN [Sneathiella sp. DP05]|uniref:Flagellar motor switch protein FliN n=2 Tax=Sneathiella litorea TaxID=2606216 RepID=A0A6L8W534_9PROT|nr:flagellar motor switch protein FliN [Sneathiella litorea]
MLRSDNVAEDEELNLEDLGKPQAPETDIAIPEETANNMASDDIDTDEDTEIARTAADLEAVFDIPVHVTAVLGKSRMRVSQLLKLGRGAVIELDRKVGEAIDIYVNNRLVARGEVVVVEDRLGVTMTEIIKADRR